MKGFLFRLLLNIRKGVYVSLASFDRVLKRENSVFVLAYHSVASDNFRFSVDASVVKKQILALKKTHDFITLADLKKYIAGNPSTRFARSGKKNAVILTFDDGYKDILLLKSFFVKHDIRPALFVLSDTKHANEKEIGKKPEFLTEKDLKELIKLGWEIGSHSATHGNLRELKSSGLRATSFIKEAGEEIIDSKETLEKELGVPIPYFSYPRGKYNDDVVKLVKKAGYTLAVTMDDGFIDAQTNPLLVPRVGIDRTHTFAEFRATYSPSVVGLRRLIKKTIIKKFL